MLRRSVGRASQLRQVRPVSSSRSSSSSGGRLWVTDALESKVSSGSSPMVGVQPRGVVSAAVRNGGLGTGAAGRGRASGMMAVTSNAGGNVARRLVSNSSHSGNSSSVGLGLGMSQTGGRTGTVSGVVWRSMHVSAVRGQASGKSGASAAAAAAAASSSSSTYTYAGVMTVAGATVLVYVMTTSETHGAMVAEASEQSSGSSGVRSRGGKPNAAAQDVSSVPNNKKFKYVIIGGGTAGFAALKTLVQRDPHGEVLMICAEDKYPYSRPPLSKELWLSNRQGADKTTQVFKDWEGKPIGIQYAPRGFYENANITVLLNTKAEKLNINEHQIVLDSGKVVRFEKCLIATGSSPRQIDIRIPEECEEKVGTFRGYKDFANLNIVSKEVEKILVVGGGFLGCELTVALVDRGKQNGRLKVVQAFPEGGMLGNVLPRYLSDYTTMKIREEGVDVRPDTYLEKVERTDDDRLEVSFTNDTSVVVDHIVFCLGVEPNVEIARGSGLELDPVNGGIIANAELEARSDIFVAGDVASYYDEMLEGRRRVEHHDHAYFTGVVAGENMTGAKRPYTHSSMYWSDLGNISFEAVGEIDRSLASISFWANKPAVQSKEDNPHPIAKIARHDPFQKGVIYYLNKDKRVVGALLWNTPDAVMNVRKLIKTRKTFASRADRDALRNVVSLD